MGPGAGRGSFLGFVLHRFLRVGCCFFAFLWPKPLGFVLHRTDMGNPLVIQFWMNNDLHVFHGSFLHSGLIVEP
jgi:hypothetical protein